MIKIVKVFVVEDDHSLRLLYEKALSLNGYEVIGSAKDGDQAVKMYQEFLDKPDEKKTIALTMDWKSPGHNWFFYPLMGRHLQNNVTYISAKYKWEAPTWLHRGLLRGHDFSIWLHNLKKKKVDYVLAQTPWPVELQWMKHHEDKFHLMLSDKNCKIFKYAREAT